MKLLLQLFLFGLILTFSKDAFAQVYKTESGAVEFLSKAPLNEFTGKSGKLNGLVDLEKQTFDFFIDLNTISTGIGLRDRHMRENYLETKKYPFAEFVGKIKEEISVQKGASKNATAIGKFKIHGVERSIEVPGKITFLSEDEIRLEAKFIVKLSDYKIDVPKVVFYELAEEQEVTINTILRK